MLPFRNRNIWVRISIFLVALSALVLVIYGSTQRHNLNSFVLPDSIVFKGEEDIVHLRNGRNGNHTTFKTYDVLSTNNLKWGEGQAHFKRIGFSPFYAYDVNFSFRKPLGGKKLAFSCKLSFRETNSGRFVYCLDCDKYFEKQMCGRKGG